jgi:hypothetical protein
VKLQDHTFYILDLDSNFIGDKKNNSRPLTGSFVNGYLKYYQGFYQLYQEFTGGRDSDSLLAVLSVDRVPLWAFMACSKVNFTFLPRIYTVTLSFVRLYALR